MRGESDARVRLATEDDGDELARMRWEFTLELSDEEPIETWVDFRSRFVARWVEHVSSRRFKVWVAESVDDASRRLVGCVWVETIAKVPRPIPHADEMGYVTNVYVAPGWRNRGLGSQLLQAAIEDARTRGFHELFLWPSDRSVPYYRRAGFEPATEVLELRIRAE